MGDAEAMKLAAAVPFRQSLVAVDGAGDEAADNKVTFLFCTQLVCCTACVHGTVWLCLDGGWRSCCGSWCGVIQKEMHNSYMSVA